MGTHHPRFDGHRPTLWLAIILIWLIDIDAVARSNFDNRKFIVRIQQNCLQGFT